MILSKILSNSNIQILLLIVLILIVYNFYTKSKCEGFSVGGINCGREYNLISGWGQDGCSQNDVYDPNQDDENIDNRQYEDVCCIPGTCEQITGKGIACPPNTISNSEHLSLDIPDDQTYNDFCCTPAPITPGPITPAPITPGPITPGPLSQECNTYLQSLNNINPNSACYEIDKGGLSDDSTPECCDAVENQGTCDLSQLPPDILSIINQELAICQDPNTNPRITNISPPPPPVNPQSPQPPPPPTTTTTYNCDSSTGECNEVSDDTGNYETRSACNVVCQASPSPPSPQPPSPQPPSPPSPQSPPPAPGPCNDSDCNNHGTASGNRPDCSCDCNDGYTGTNCDRPPLASCVIGSTWSSTGNNSSDDCELCTSHEVLLSPYNNYPNENIDPNYLSYSDILTGFNECTLTEDATISLSRTDRCTRKLYAPRNEPNKIVDGLPELQYYYSSSGTDCRRYPTENLCKADIDCAWNQTTTNPYHEALLRADMSYIWRLLKTLWDDSGGINLFDGEDSETYVGDGVNGVGCCDTRFTTAEESIEEGKVSRIYGYEEGWSDDDLLDDYSCIEDQIVNDVDDRGHITDWSQQEIGLDPTIWFDQGDSTCSDRQSPIRSVDAWNAFIDKKETCKFDQSGFEETLQAFGLEYTPTVKYKCGWDLLMATISLDFGDVNDSGGDGVFTLIASGAGAGVSETFTAAFTPPSTGSSVADTALNLKFGTSKKKNLKRFAEWYKNAPTNRFMKGRFKKGMSLFSSKCSKGLY